MARNGFRRNTVLELLFLDQIGDHVLHDEVVQCVTTKTLVPSGAQDLDFLNSFVESASILHRATLETQDTGCSGPGTHVIDDVILRISTLRNTGEGTASGVVQTNRETFTDERVDIQPGQLRRQLKTLLFLRSVERWKSDHGISDIRSLPGQSISISFNLLQLHSQELLNQKGLLLLRLTQPVTPQSNSSPPTRSCFQLQSRIPLLICPESLIIDIKRDAQQGFQVRENVVGIPCR